MDLVLQLSKIVCRQCVMGYSIFPNSMSVGLRNVIANVINSKILLDMQST